MKVDSENNPADIGSKKDTECRQNHSSPTAAGNGRSMSFAG